MSELGEIHEKINRVSEGVVEIKTILDLSLPNLATDDSVKLAIAEHSAGCEKTEKRGSLKRDTAIIASTGTLIIAASKAIQYFFF